MRNCKDCRNPGCSKCGTTHSMSDCVLNKTAFHQEQKQFNQKKQWEEPNIQKVLKPEILDL